MAPGLRSVTMQRPVGPSGMALLAACLLVPQVAATRPRVQPQCSHGSLGAAGGAQGSPYKQPVSRAFSKRRVLRGEDCLTIFQRPTVILT